MFDAMGSGQQPVRSAWRAADPGADLTPLLYGVGRDEILAVAWTRVPAPLRHLIRDIELSEGPSVPHQGLVVDTVAWRATSRPTGREAASGTIFIWCGRIL